MFGSGGEIGNRPGINVFNEMSGMGNEQVSHLFYLLRLREAYRENVMSLICFFQIPIFKAFVK